jgi:hypothetical protein
VLHHLASDTLRAIDLHHLSGHTTNKNQCNKIRWKHRVDTELEGHSRRREGKQWPWVPRWGELPSEKQFQSK